MRKTTGERELRIPIPSYRINPCKKSTLKSIKFLTVAPVRHNLTRSSPAVPIFVSAAKKHTQFHIYFFRGAKLECIKLGREGKQTDVERHPPPKRGGKECFKAEGPI